MGHVVTGHAAQADGWWPWLVMTVSGAAGIWMVACALSPRLRALGGWGHGKETMPMSQFSAWVWALAALDFGGMAGAIALHRQGLAWVAYYSGFIIFGVMLYALWRDRALERRRKERWKSDKAAQAWVDEGH